MTTLLIDAGGLIYRAYYGTEKREDGFKYRTDGLPTHAIREFTESMLYLLFKGVWRESERRYIVPDRIGLCFDSPGPGWRHGLYPQYKANRPAKPENLTAQMPYFRTAARALGLEPLEVEGFEADDLIATYARLARDEGDEVLIYSADKDLMQLVRYGVTIYSPGMGVEGYMGYRPSKWISEVDVLERFGVVPSKVTDVQTLQGDSVDGVPGIPGCGVKTAAALINEYGSAEAVILCRNALKKKFADWLNVNSMLLRISRSLVTLADDVEVEIPLSMLGRPSVDPGPLYAFIDEMEFTLLRHKAEEFLASAAA